MRTSGLRERIGAISIPETARVIGVDDAVRPPSGLALGGGPQLRPQLGVVRPDVAIYNTAHRTVLTEGCYRVEFTPLSPCQSVRDVLVTTRFRGTLRVERVGRGYRISGDLYRYSLFEALLDAIPSGVGSEGSPGSKRPPLADMVLAVLDDDTDRIPIYRRRDYHSYLEGTAASMWSSDACAFWLQFNEWTYDHPATGFDGSFDDSPARSVTYRFQMADDADVYTGDAYEGTTKIGTVCLRHVSEYFRRAALQIDTVQGAKAPTSVFGNWIAPPPAAHRPTLDSRAPIAESVSEEVPSPFGLDYGSFWTIFETAGWDLTVNYSSDPIRLPDSLAGVDVTDCDSWLDGDGDANLYAVMEAAPGYNPGGLDFVWRAHLIAHPAGPNCRRLGRLFDQGTRQGAVTFSHDSYPPDIPCARWMQADGNQWVEYVPAQYGAAAGKPQHQVPRAFLRSAAHEVGHIFNQIHGTGHPFDNSIMTTTQCASAAIHQAGGSFPDDIDLSFNADYRRHMIHLPDPVVRPGGMGFLSGYSQPEATEANVLDYLTVEVQPASTRIRLGEPLPVRLTLRNNGAQSVPVPTSLDTEDLTARVSVTNAAGRTTFMRPPAVDPCPRVRLKGLEPQAAVDGETVVFYGQDGFAFEESGRHTINVVILWPLGRTYVAAEGSVDVWVAYPLTEEDDRIARLMLDSDVGEAIATRSFRERERARERLAQVGEVQAAHPVNTKLKHLGLVG